MQSKIAENTVKKIQFTMQNTAGELVMLGTEQAEQVFVKAIDSGEIKTWEHFEYVLSFIVENRFLRIY